MHTQTILPAAGVVIAAAAAVIAFQQWRTNHNQFRFALFQRRIGVYDAVIELMAIIAGKGEVTWEQLRGYAVKTREASFIFDDQVQAYCNEVYKRGVKLMVAHHVVETAPGAPSYKQMVESEGELLSGSASSSTLQSPISNLFCEFGRVLSFAFGSDQRVLRFPRNLKI
jgi:hypothetical protein